MAERRGKDAGMNIYVDSKMSDGDRRRELYQGSLFVHSPCPSALKLCRLGGN